MRSKSRILVVAIWLILILAIACIGYVVYKSNRSEVSIAINLLVLSFSFLTILLCSSFLFWSKKAKECNKLMISLYVTPYLWLIVIMILSVVAVPFLKSEMKSEDVTNFYTAFIALCTTFVVGFQIYNSIELNKKIEELNTKNALLENKWMERQQALEEESRAQRNELLEEIRNTKKLISKNNYYNAYNLATMRYTLAFAERYNGDKRLCWNSMRSYFLALKYAAEGGHDFHESLESIGTKIKKCISELSNPTESGTFHRINYSRNRFIREINMCVDDILILLENSDKSNATVSRFIDLQNDWLKFIKIFETES